MNRTRTNAFQIDGKPMPAPDRDMESSYYTTGEWLNYKFNIIEC